MIRSEWWNLMEDRDLPVWYSDSPKIANPMYEKCKMRVDRSLVSGLIRLSGVRLSGSSCLLLSITTGPLASSFLASEKIGKSNMMCIVLKEAFLITCFWLIHHDSHHLWILLRLHESLARPNKTIELAWWFGFQRVSAQQHSTVKSCFTQHTLWNQSSDLKIILCFCNSVKKSTV